MTGAMVAWSDDRRREPAMSLRNLSPQQMFERLALQHRPLHRFTGRPGTPSPEAGALPAVWPRCDVPGRVLTRLLAEWEHDGLSGEV
jgi:hypothetical protein